MSNHDCHTTVSANDRKAKILICEDDANLLDVLKALFRSLGHKVRTAADDDELRKLVTDDRPNILICSCHAWNSLPTTGRPHTIVTAAYDEIQLANQAITDGADARLTKPLRTQDAINAVNHILNQLPPEDETPQPAPVAPETDDEPEPHFGAIIGEHPAMLQLFATIRQVASTDIGVLIRGESGVGKELVAKAIHAASPRADKPFVAINCTAVPANLLESELFGHVRGAFTGALKAKEGLFSAADGGTIFLDEIGSIPISMQLSLLRVLQDRTLRPVGATTTRTVDVRVIAATNENLEQRIQDGLFRDDLFFRLAAFPLSVPPLRERLSDIPLLAKRFLQQFARQQGKTLSLAAETLETLTRHSWPGNVRELQNTIARAATVAPDQASISPDMLMLPQTETATPPRSQAAPAATGTLTLKAYLKICERDYIQQVLQDCHGDKEQAATKLGVSLGTLYRKLEA